MAGHYDLRSHGQDSNLYAVLPGTSSGSFVQHNLTARKSKATAGRGIPGCNPARWIYELLNNNFTVCDLFERAKHANLDYKFDWQHTHRLVMSGKHSYHTANSRLLSAICLDCHFHFLFKMAHETTHGQGSICNPRQQAWPMRGNLFPWHHLLWAGSESESIIAATKSKYYPLLAREFFVCSAPPCTFELTLEVSEPRLKPWFTELLLDRDAILVELALAQEREPTRYEAASEAWASQAPSNLNTYLKNLEESEEKDLRNISKRNKRFAVLFGPRCFKIFRELEFIEQEDLNEDGVDEGVFVPKPPPPPKGPAQPSATGSRSSTELGTYRAYIEDVRSEIQCLIYKSNAHPEEPPTFIESLLHQELECKQVPGVARNALVNTERYQLLGVLPDQSREVIVNAYMRQWELLPNRRRDLVNALMAMANDRVDEPLVEYAMTQSSVFDSQLPRQSDGDDDGLLNQALIYLGLGPPNTYNSEVIVDAFRRKLIESPGEASTARSMLMLIAQASSDDMYQLQLVMEADTKMSLETSRAVLGLTEWTLMWQEILKATENKLLPSQSKDEKVLFLNALEAIADHQDDLNLKQATIELRHRFKVFADNNDSGDADNGPADMDLPVGLNNIGNTCYLNSLLQYFFTVRVVRDVVLNYDDYRLQLDDAAIQERKLGGNKMQMDRGEAVVAQAFVRELGDLFKNLQSSNKRATRPSQRLANAVLYSTHTILEKSKVKPETAEVNTVQPPPLPRRPNSAQNTVASTETKVKAAPEIAVDEHDISSMTSSCTLVGAAELAQDQGPTSKDDETMTDILADQEPDAKSISDDQIPDLIDISIDSKAADGDVAMSGTGQLNEIDERVLKGLEHQDRSSGTEQQDVEEVIGSMINKLQAAIRPGSEDEESGIQFEKVMETFFVTTINYTKKFDDEKYQSETSFDRSITAFPAPDGPCSLYEALGRNFDQQMIHDSKLSRYTAIKNLPPVLHVLIQRSQSIGQKNNNPVEIPNILYLDRFMDAPHGSDAFKHRVQEWSISSRLSDVRSLVNRCQKLPDSGTFIETLSSQHEGSESERADLQRTMDLLTQERPTVDSWDFDGEMEEPELFRPLSPIQIAGEDESSLPEDFIQLEKGIQKEMAEELQQLQDALNEHHGGHQQTSYRLQAVICHRGAMNSGHYWVWIHDFESSVWRKYNDETVDVESDTNKVLETLCSTGEPYYLCYVRDSDKEQHVSVPKRALEKSVGNEQTEIIEDGEGESKGFFELDMESVKADPSQDAVHEIHIAPRSDGMQD